MILPNQLDKKDLERAFNFLRSRDNEVVKIVSNPAFEDLLYEAGGGIPVELDETELGIRFIGREGSNDYGESVRIRVLNEEGYLKFKETVGCCSESNEPDASVVRAWTWDDAPPCLKQLSEHGGDEDWVFLVPPKLFGAYINWLDTLGTNDDRYLLPGGWQVLIVAH